MPVLYYTFPAGKPGCSVKNILLREWRLSTSLLSRLKQNPHGILLNGLPVSVNTQMAPGDRLQADVSDKATDEAYSPYPLALEICYEDEFFMVLNKPPGLATHPSTLDLSAPSLPNALAFHWDYGNFTFHPVNRLDRGTSGLMAVAKCGYIHQQFAAQLRDGRFFRRYLAVSQGTPPQPQGRITLPIAREEGSLIKRRVSPEGTAADTEYHILEQHGPYTLLELTPHTGRTHQLRVHMAALGCPLAGDWLYGQEDREKISRPALHSAYLQLYHPITGIQMHFTAAPPQDMQQLLKQTKGAI